VVVASLVLVVALAWVYLWHDASAMHEMAASGHWVAPAVESHRLDAGTAVMTFAMWTIMMVGMMLPSAAPTILLYGTMVRKNAQRGTALPATWVFTAGYLFVWTVFSLIATVLQLGLEESELLTPMMVSASRWLSGLVLLAAGVYQWTGLKQACLSKCRSPLEFFLTRWRSGQGGALRMGAEHGVYCVGCCWALMLLLFVAGVMNLLWVAVIAGFVLAEKLLPAAKWTSRLAGAVLTAGGALVLIHG